MTNEEVRDLFSAAVSKTLAETDEMVTKWVAVVESIDSDGKRALWTLSDEHAKPWDTLGLLAFATQQEQAMATLNELADDG